MVKLLSFAYSFLYVCQKVLFPEYVFLKINITMRKRICYPKNLTLC